MPTITSHHPCHSVFKSGNSVPTPEQFTELWISMIQLIEQGEETLAAS